MRHATTSPTPSDPLASRPDAPVIRDIAHLGGRGTLYLLALIQAHRLRQRVAPTLEASTAVLLLLDALGVVRAEHQAPHMGNFTLVEKLHWSYTWPHVSLNGLESRLVDYLTSIGRSATYADTWLKIWQELLPAQVVAYVQRELRIHNFSDNLLAEVLPFLSATESRYSLGNWRYACWASVQSMASVALQHPGNLELLKFTLRSELPYRLQIALESPGEKFCLSPSASIPAGTLSTAFSSIATRLDDNFWKSPPTQELL